MDESPLSLAKQSDRGDSLLRERSPTRAHKSYLRWVKSTSRTIEALRPGAGLTAEWFALPRSSLVDHDGYYDSPEAWEHFHYVVKNRLVWLSNTFSTKKAEEKKSPMNADSSSVFIVHGHDNAVCSEAARLLSKLQLDPDILHEQPNGGKTIIEKFETHSSGAAFAVVLLTADDVGGKNGDATESLNSRARQNVVLELGYFYGRLGRNKVCAVYEEGVELPSDLQGIVWVLLDSGGAWKTELAKELRSAGLSVDLNNLI